MVFNDIDSGSTSAFLKTFRKIWDSIGIQGGAAAYLIYFLMKKPALPSLEVRLPPNKNRANGLHVQWLSSYVEVFNYLLTKYATDEIIAHTIKKL